MSWTNTTLQIRISISLHDEAPDVLVQQVETAMNEASRDLAKKIEALNLPADQIVVEVWGW